MSTPLAQQQFSFPQPTEAALTESIARLADDVSARYQEENRTTYLTTLYRLQIAAGRYAEAVASLAALRESSLSAGDQPSVIRRLPFEIYARARVLERDTALAFAEAYDQSFRAAFGGLTDNEAIEAAWSLGTPVANYRQDLQAALDQRTNKSDISVVD